MEEKKFNIWRFSPYQLFRLFIELLTLILVVLAFILLVFFPEAAANVFNYLFDSFSRFLQSLDFLK